MLALATQNFDGSERFGLRTHPHAKILSKFEVLGPRNGRGATWQNASQVKGPRSASRLTIRRRVPKPHSVGHTSVEQRAIHSMAGLGERGGGGAGRR